MSIKVKVWPIIFDLDPDLLFLNRLVPFLFDFVLFPHLNLILFLIFPQYINSWQLYYIQLTTPERVKTTPKEATRKRVVLRSTS